MYFSTLVAITAALSSQAATQEASPPNMQTDLSKWGYYLHIGGRALGTYDTAHPGLYAAVGLRGPFMRAGAFLSFSPASFKRFRFDNRLPEGETYRGQSVVRLGAQEIFSGLYLSGVVDVPGVSWLSVEVPIGVGPYILGTPLMDDDRTTPDGDRVSVWEDRITGASDVNFGLGVDAGLVIRLRPAESLPWLSMGVGGHYTFVFGIDANVVGDNVAGPAGSLSVIIEG